MKSLIVIGLVTSVSFLAASEDLPIASDTGSVSVAITWDGKEIPERKPQIVDAKAAEGCCAEGESVDKRSRDLVVSEAGGVANIVITLEPTDGKAKIEPREAPYVLDQKSCRMEPHILAVPMGSTIRYQNSDKVSHNVHTLSRLNATFNETVAAGGHKDKKASKAEVIKVVCDIHPWMSASVVVVDTPYCGVTGADGTITVTDVPPGTYKAAWWHETLGKGKFKDAVTVTAGGTAAITEKVKEGGKKKRGRGRR